MNSKIIAAVIVGLVIILAGVRFLMSAPPAPVVEAAKEHAPHAEERLHVELKPEQIAKAGIKTEVAGPATIREVLSLYGTVVPNAERMRDISARFPGAIRSVAKKVGDAVKQGEALATVESNESLQVYSISAPLAGVVTARSAHPGEQTGDKVLFSVADLSAVWVEVSLFPRDAAKVRAGQPVRVTSTDAGVTGAGSITYVAPVGTTANQTRSARVLLDNKDNQWAPGLYVNADVTLGEISTPLAVRSQALQNVNGKETVFVRTQEGFEPRAVRLGRSDNDYSEVVEGLRAGETYATENSFILKAELGKGEAAHED